MRRKQFGQLISDLRAELERSSDPAVGVSDLPTLKQKIARTYETLYDEHDWPHLNQMFPPIALQAGQRYYDFPDDLDFDRLEQVVVWYSGRPFEAIRGIGFEQFAFYNSEEDERSDPAQRWDVRFVQTKEQVEVWPVPASNNTTLQFKGTRKFAPLINDSDLCLLDDNMVVLFAAAELAPAKSGNKQVFLSAAQQRLARVKGRMDAGDSRLRVGMGRSEPRPMSRAIVRVSG